MNHKHFFISFIGLFFIATASLANAAEKASKLDTKQYSPNYCQFSATLPEEPYISRKCDGDKEESCYDLISYTKVFDVSSTVRIEIICNPSTPKLFESLTQKAMETTVRAMTKDSVIEAFEVNSRDAGDYRQSGLVGKGRVGKDDSIYIAQLWSASNSLMSVKAELIGAQMEESDKMFAAILRSIGYIGELKEIPEENKKKPANNSGNN